MQAKPELCERVASAWVKRRLEYLGVAPLLFGLGVGMLGTAYAQSGLPKTTATFVWGQTGNPTTNTANKGGISRTSLSGPTVFLLDSDGGVYLTDRNNNRVLHYPKGSDSADIVYGQQNSFTTNTGNKGGISETTLNIPGGLALDGAGGLYIADTTNHRILHFPKGSTNADFVLGQNGKFNTNTANNGGISEVSLNNPNGLAADGTGGVYVGDQGNNRVLHFPKGINIADMVLGQGGSFTTGTANKGGITDSSLNLPCCVASDGAGGVYVSDLSNNRVLHFPKGSTSADRVYGQGTSFTTNTQNKGGISRSSLFAPEHLTLDSAGGLYVADTNNNRVLHYPAGSNVADGVYGQLGDFTTNASNKTGQTDFDGLNNPVSAGVDRDGALYIGDFINNRGLKYDAVIVGVSATPASLTFRAAADSSKSPKPDPQTISFTTSGPSTFMATITFSSVSGWLKVDPASGTASTNTASPTKITVTADQLAIPTGTVQATIRITAGGGFQDIPVSLIVGPTGCGCDFNADGSVDISDIISLVRQVVSGTAPACHSNNPWSIADVIHLVNVVVGTIDPSTNRPVACRL